MGQWVKILEAKPDNQVNLELIYIQRSVKIEFGFF